MAGRSEEAWSEGSLALRETSSEVVGDIDQIAQRLVQENARSAGFDRASSLPSRSATVDAQQLLTDVYTALLRYEPRPCPETGRFVLVKSRDVRRARGAYYTPPSAARLVVEAALQPLIQHRRPPPRVLDPTLGTGVFLVEALRFLVKRGYEAVPVATTCLAGVDRDPVAVRIAVLSLWLETGVAPAVLAESIRPGDLLDEVITGDGENRLNGRFDAVIGNPPWGAAVTTDERTRLRRHFPELTGTFDSFKPFVALAVRLTGGTVGMILPQAVLAQDTHRDVRALLLDRLEPYLGVDLGGDCFPGAAAPACALVFGPGGDGGSAQSVARERQTRCPRWSASHFAVSDHDLLDLLERLQRRHGTLADRRHLYRIRDVGINYSSAALARRILYSGPRPEHPGDLPRYRGRDFARYTSVAASGWLRHDAPRLVLAGERLSIGWETFARGEKIAVRQTADRVVATLDTTRWAMGRSVIAITGEGQASLLPLLACLNSRLMSVLYRALAGEQGRVLPQVKVARLAALPIPDVKGAVPEERAPNPEGVSPRDQDDLWSRLGDAATAMLQGGGRDESLDAGIDQVVYRFYDLSNEEIALVEST